MKVEEVMNRNVYSCKSSDSLKSAAQSMWDHDIGCLAVIDDKGVAIGMVTDRDLLMCATLNGSPLSDLPISRAMSKEVHSVRMGEPVRTAETLMQSKQVRRLLVMGPEGRLAGIISLNDLALAAGKKRDVRPEDVVATLASICQPRPHAATARG